MRGPFLSPKFFETMIISHLYTTQGLYLNQEDRQMPVHRTRGGGYQYGQRGKVYHGKGAKAKAARQGRAIQASKRRHH
jgi:hypothetical protein